MPADNAGNSLKNANPIKFKFGEVTTFSDFVGDDDPRDLYSFKLTRRSALTITATGRRETPGLLLLDKDGDLFDTPKATVDKTQFIDRKSLKVGTYYIEVTSDEQTRYDLVFRVRSRKDARFRYVDPDGAGTKENDKAANRRRQGRGIEVDGDIETYSDFVGPKDPIDYYQFTTDRRSELRVILQNLRANADLVILDSDGNKIASSRNKGTAVESLDRIVLERKETYYIKVRRARGNTRYSITVAAFPRNPDGGGGDNEDPEFDFNLINNINAGEDSSIRPFDPDPGAPPIFVDFNGTLYFAADNGVVGTELWRSDGTEDGTELVANINASPDEGSNPSDFVVIGDLLYFTADDGIQGREIWRTDGTEAGTELVADVNAGSDSSNPSDLADFNGSLFFAADSDVFGREIFRIDDPSGDDPTVSALDVNPGQEGSNPTDLIQVGGTLYFAADNDVFGRELYASTDGTLANSEVININIGGAEGSSNPTDLVDVDGTLYFAADDGINGRELFTSDGTQEGTELVFDINNDDEIGSDPSDLVNVDGVLYFAADDGVFGRELWRSDGTADGTEIADNINASPDQGSNPTDLVNFNGVLFFAADNGIVGREIFTFDATDPEAEDATLAANINASPNEGSDPAELTVVGETLFFAADDGSGLNGRELFGLQASDTQVFLRNRRSQQRSRLSKERLDSSLWYRYENLSARYL